MPLTRIALINCADRLSTRPALWTTVGLLPGRSFIVGPTRDAARRNLLQLFRLFPCCRESIGRPASIRLDDVRCTDQNGHSRSARFTGGLRLSGNLLQSLLGSTKTEKSVIPVLSTAMTLRQFLIGTGKSTMRANCLPA